MGKFYQDEGYDSFLEVKGPQSLSQRVYSLVKPWALNWKSRLIEKFHPQKGALLDVGAGTGAFLKTMKERGWESTGVEKDETAAKFCREKLELQVHPGDLADVEGLNSKFDAVTFWHSLEHIHRFKENLKIVRDNLKENGILCIALPNCDSLDAKAYGRYWAAYDAPRHLWHFTPGVMERVLKSTGFTLERTVPMPLDPFYNSLLSETITPGKIQLRFLFRLPVVSSLSYLNGIMHPAKASSVVYIAYKKDDS